MAEELPRVLEATLSADDTARTQANDWLENAKQHNRAELLAALATELRNVERQSSLRQQAGLQLKNCLTGQHDSIRDEDIQAWLALPEEARSHVKNEAIATLGTEQPTQSTAAQVIAAIALIEIPQNLWPDVIPNLLDLVAQPQAPESLKVAGLQAVGYITDDVTEEDPDLLVSHANKLLTTIINMIASDGSAHVQLAAINALRTSLEFCRHNFEQEGERNAIMSTICNSAVSPNEEVKVAGLLCVVQVAALYYQHLRAYMAEALIPITTQAIQAENHEVAKQGLEFWTTVADEEVELLYDAEEARSTGQTTTVNSQHYCQGALQTLIPLVLESLAKQDEDDDEDDWTVSKAAAVCLSFLAECCTDSVFQLCLPFIQNNMANPDWRYRDASVLAFGNILKGPDEDTVRGVTNEALMPMLELIKDPSVVVQDSVAWMLGMICDLFPEIVTQTGVMQSVLMAMDLGLSKEPRVANNMCHAIAFLVEGVYEQAMDSLGDAETDVRSTALSDSYQTMLQRLIAVTDRPDVQESNLRSAAFEALSSALQYAPLDCYPVVVSITNDMLTRLTNCGNMQINSQNELRQYADIVCGLVSTISTAIRRLNIEEIRMLAPNAIPLLLQVMSTDKHSNTSVVEDALICLDAFVEGMGNEIAPMVDTLKPIVVSCVSQVQHGATCFAAVGVVGDICRQLQRDAAPHCNEFMEVLLQALTATDVARNVKPAVLSAFNDMALALGDGFSVYLEVVFQVLESACQHAIQPEFDDEDSLEYINELRHGLLEAYTGIVQAMAGPKLQLTEALNAMSAHLSPVIGFISSIIGLNMSDDVIRLSCGLLGDLSQAFGSTFGQALNPGLVDQLSQLGESSSNSQTRTMAKYMVYHAKKAGVQLQRV
eukprot:TRINITY_DN9980_c0_g1_i1.p1 TRINITY_DN9980_c0_g1~~TRINITY_DN9980_c0_g1_i1.p1  ORF type:complete len:885 (+),score=271.75 TRINITY_DN9980_c0_g1_i1:59-2713(+)